MKQLVEVFRFLATVAMLLHHTDSLGITELPGEDGILKNSSLSFPDI